MRKLSLPALTFVVLGIATQASAAWSSSSYRCVFDSVSNDQAWGRQQWAQRCGHLRGFGHSSAEADDSAMVELFLYPVYTDPMTFEAWRGPGAAGSPTASYTGAQIASLPCTFKPAHIFADGLCEPRIGFTATVLGQAPQSEHVDEANRLGLRLDVPEDAIPGH